MRGRTGAGRARAFTRLVGVVGAVGATLLASASACTPDGPHTIVIGDSLTVGAQEQGLGNSGPRPWSIHAESGRTTNEGIEMARRLGIGDDDTVIVALGTNDYLDTKGTYGVRIDKMMEQVGRARRVVWVNVDANTPKLAPARSGVNAALTSALDRHPRLEIADWHRYVGTVSGFAAMREPDGVHYRPAGDAVRARWMAGVAAG